MTFSLNIILIHVTANKKILLFYMAVYNNPLDFPGGTSGKEPACQCRRHKRHGFNLWVGKIPWNWAWWPTPVLLPGESNRGAWSIGSQRDEHYWTDIAYTQYSVIYTFYIIFIHLSVDGDLCFIGNWKLLLWTLEYIYLFELVFLFFFSYIPTSRFAG